MLLLLIQYQEYTVALNKFRGIKATPNELVVCWTCHMQNIEMKFLILKKKTIIPVILHIIFPVDRSTEPFFYFYILKY